MVASHREGMQTSKRSAGRAKRLHVNEKHCECKQHREAMGQHLLMMRFQKKKGFKKVTNCSLAHMMLALLPAAGALLAVAALYLRLRGFTSTKRGSWTSCALFPVWVAGRVDVRAAATT